jgi:transposase
MQKCVSILFLPQYSPDLNPIRLMWSKLNTVLRKLKAMTHKDLQNALQQAFNYISKLDIKNWFIHDYYNC